MFHVFVYERGKKTGSVFEGTASSTIGEAIESAGFGNIAEFAVVDGRGISQDEFNFTLDNFDREVIQVEVVPYYYGIETENARKLSFLSGIANVIATEIAIAIPLLIYCRYFW